MPDSHIYKRVARALEDDILTGLIREGEIVPSTHQYAAFFDINPGTAAKGVALLTAEGILEKKRGIGLFVAQHARERILVRRRQAFRDEHLLPCLQEAQKLGISRQNLLAMLMAER